VSLVASSNCKVVQHLDRRRKASELADTKSIVIWGIPTFPLTVFWKIICKPVSKERVVSIELKAAKRGGRFLFVTLLTPLVRGMFETTHVCLCGAGVEGL
jgi:hypothetical protein